MTSAEDFVDAAVAALIGRLDAQLDAQEAKYAATAHPLPLPRPRYAEAPDGDFWPGGVAELLRYPTVEIALPDARGENFSIDQHDGDAFGSVIVRVWHFDPQFPRLYRSLCRYAAAIHDVLVARDPVTLRGTGFGPDTSITRWRAAWRFNPELEQRDEVASAALLAYEIDAPDIRP